MGLHHILWSVVPRWLYKADSFHSKEDSRRGFSNVVAVVKLSL